MITFTVVGGIVTLAVCFTESIKNGVI